MSGALVQVRTVPIEAIVVSLRLQLRSRHGIDARYTAQHIVRGRTVLEFLVTNRGNVPLHVVADGSGPGRAAWVIGASSADQAVEATEWNVSVRAEAMENQEDRDQQDVRLQESPVLQLAERASPVALSRGDRSGLAEIEERALAILRKGPTTCARLGEALWGKKVTSNCSCPYARPAGALVKRLRERGLVERVPDKHYTLWGAK